MPAETIHLIIGVLFFAVWALVGAMRVRERHANGSHTSGRDPWHQSSHW